MKKWLFNPFVYIAGSRALFFGLAIMLLTAGICFFSNAHFDGVVDTHTASVKAPFFIYLAEQLNVWGCSILLFYVAAVIFSKSSVRFIDIAGTLALARWPMLFCALLSFAIHPAAIHNVSDISPTFMAIAFVSLLFVAWMIALMYNAFKISANLKNEQAVAIFIIVLLLTELITHFISFHLYKHFI